MIARVVYCKHAVCVRGGWTKRTRNIFTVVGRRPLEHFTPQLFRYKFPLSGNQYICDTSIKFKLPPCLHHRNSPMYPGMRPFGFPPLICLARDGSTGATSSHASLDDQGSVLQATESTLLCSFSSSFHLCTYLADCMPPIVLSIHRQGRGGGAI